MHFNKVLIALQALLLIFITFCLERALTASSRRTHQKGRSASLRIFPVHQRHVEGDGRAALDLGSVYDKEPVLVDSAGEGRDLMKKFMLFKSLFTQQKSEPNVVIISQPPTTTMPTATGTTTTTATRADTPTFDGNTGRGTQAQDDPDDEDVFGVLGESKPEEVQVQQLIKQTKPNKKRLKKLNKQLTKAQKQQQQQQQQWQWQRQQQQQRQQYLQRNKRKRLANRLPQQTKPQRNRQQETLLNKINLSQQPNQKSSNNSNNNNNYNNKHNDSSNNNNNTNHNNNNNMASGILNLNTNMRLQNIMNAFRKQTPIVYNY